MEEFSTVPDKNGEYYGGIVHSSWQNCRAGTPLISFPSKLLVFCPKRSEWVICSKKWAIHSFAHFWWATWAICSWLHISSEWPERIAHGPSFLVSDLSDSLTSLIFGEQPERFTHIAHLKRGIEGFANFFNKKFEHTKKQDFSPKFFFCEALIRSFPLRDRSKLLTVAHLSWAT